MYNRITPNYIKKLEKNQVFVFGSNLSGIHGGGAARTALRWGAIWGQAIGLQGKTYAIPTKSIGIQRTLTVDEIKPYVDTFIEFAKNNKHLSFLVTPIGCGLAGMKPEEIAPLFKLAVNKDNIYLPLCFLTTLKQESPKIIESEMC